MKNITCNIQTIPVKTNCGILLNVYITAPLKSSPPIGVELFYKRGRGGNGSVITNDRERISKLEDYEVILFASKGSCNAKPLSNSITQALMSGKSKITMEINIPLNELEKHLYY